MKKVVILLLHMRHGGIEKQTINFANELCKDVIAPVTIWVANESTGFEITVPTPRATLQMGIRLK